MQKSGELVDLDDLIDYRIRKLDRDLNRELHYRKIQVWYPANEQVRRALEMWQVLDPIAEIVDRCESWRFQQQIGLLLLH